MRAGCVAGHVVPAMSAASTANSITPVIRCQRPRGPCNTKRMAQPAPRTLSRLSEIAQVMVRHGFGYFFEAHKLTDLIPGRRIADVDAMTPSARGQHLREVLEELGPTFVKFGQLLSTRPDVVPPDLIAELRPLQDDVRPFPFEQAERVSCVA